MRPGVYLHLPTARLCVFKNIEHYEDLHNEFYILTWEWTKEKSYPKTLIKGHQKKFFKYLGEL